MSAFKPQVNQQTSFVWVLKESQCSGKRSRSDNRYFMYFHRGLQGCVLIRVPFFCRFHLLLQEGSIKCSQVYWRLDFQNIPKVSTNKFVQKLFLFSAFLSKVKFSDFLKFALQSKKMMCVCTLDDSLITVFLTSWSTHDLHTLSDSKELNFHECSYFFSTKASIN